MLFALTYLTFASFLVVDEKSNTSEIAATVGGYSISSNRVDRHLKKTVGNRLPNFSNQVVRGFALDHLINRHLVMLAIKDKGFSAGESEIKFEISKLQDRLKEISKPMPEYLLDQNLTMDELQYEFAWKIVWSKYLNKTISDQTLKRFFENRKRQFDGSRIKVAHLLIAHSEDALDQAERIRMAITIGKINWSDAVAEYSIAHTSVSAEGEIGWISHQGPMHPDFCAAAMELTVGQISEPIKTPFGVHLIRALEIETGAIQYGDVKARVRSKAQAYLFTTLANSQRPETKIELVAPWTKSGASLQER